MPSEIDTIIQQMEWAASRSLAEFTITASGIKIHIQRVADPVAPRSLVAGAAQKTENVRPVHALTIDAPMAGICHLSNENGGDAFITKGDKIEIGQTICVIEAMKLMTAIPATTSGTVKAILVEDGDAIAAGTALVEVVE